ncbi:hypothetical protein LTR37_006927 [Vermiconidia calcicola]|uniref:Uncharacterized protein n=1 Tax=Vermiconidia calcicola TaxID=1690605 RepID=A0ACC3NHS1_9PEZI|nr:hypothetical protein LTR37_006927 [Vermiconidia calcicola]
MADSESFSFIEKTARPGPHHLFDDLVELTSAKSADHDLQYVSVLREHNPGMILTCTPANNVSLLTFAAAGFATYELDRETDSFASWRGYYPPQARSQKGSLAEAVDFAKYHYKWNNEDFILYTVGGYIQYILKECRDGEHPLGPSRVTDELIKSIGDWMSSISDVVWVYDNYWRRDHKMWTEIEKSSWDNVILDEDMKEDLTTVANKFFDSKGVYEELGVPWKRGLMFYGPPGNGKTISIKALMHELLFERKKDGKPDPIPTLYVKTAPYTFDIGSVFRQARTLAPCMLVLEDVETIVTPDTRSYFFNEMDGLENNDGLFIVASTNFLDKLDPGLTKRPSRFDRKYKFPIPSEHERTLYCEYWRNKLKNKKSIDFPSKLCPAMAHITPGFSFAFLQECFVATLLILAREEDEKKPNMSDPKPYDGDNDDLDDYKLWVAFKQQADILRKEINDQKSETMPADAAVFSLPAMEPQQAFPTHDGRDVQRAALNTSFLSVSSRRTLLPELPYASQKYDFNINSAAYERR